MKEKSYFKGVPPSLPPKGSRCDGCPYSVSYTHLDVYKRQRERSVIIQQYSIIYADPPWRYSAKKVQVLQFTQCSFKASQQAAIPLGRFGELWEAVKWAVKPNGAVLFFAQCPFEMCIRDSYTPFSPELFTACAARMRSLAAA